MVVETAVNVADGVLETRDGKQVVRFQRHLAHPVGRVWSALTEPAEMIGWLGDAEVELEAGGRYVVRWLNTDEQGNSAIYHGTITRLEPPHHLEVSGDIHGVLLWELQPEVGGTLLTFSSTLELPKDYWTMVLAGWHSHLDFLAGLLEGQSADLVNLGNGHWARVHELYLAQWA